MASLVGLLLPPGPALVDALVRCWADGDAVVVLDPRLPPPAQAEALRAAAPQRLWTASGVADLDGGRPVEQGDALVVLTSGTTGAARAAIITHDAVAAAAARTSDRLEVDPAHDRWLACLPLAHVGGLGVVTRALATGTPLEVLPRADPDAIGSAAVAGCTLVALVPTVLARIEPAAFRCILLGGAAPPDALPANVVTTWGLTETFGGIVYDGRPLRDVEVRAVDGELQVRTPTMARSWRDGAPVDDDEGWLHTGDGGEVTPAGEVVVHGRLADVINTGGEKVWPGRVEAVLRTHPDVAAVAVVGLSDPEWGQRVHAVVVPVDADRPPTLEGLRALARCELPPWCAPRSLSLTAALPRTALGKVRHGELRMLHATDEIGD